MYIFAIFSTLYNHRVNAEYPTCAFSLLAADEGMEHEKTTPHRQNSSKI